MYLSSYVTIFPLEDSNHLVFITLWIETQATHSKMHYMMITRTMIIVEYFWKNQALTCGGIVDSTLTIFKTFNQANQAIA